VQSSLCILSYDADGNLAGYSDGITSAEYDYDDMGRKTWERVNYGPFTKEFSYSYYGNGLKQTFTAPDSTIYTYLYGLNNELQEVQIPGLGSITIPNYTWNRPATIDYPGGTQRTYTYDALMRLQSLSVTDPSSNPLLNYQYSYDEVGNILTKTTEHGNYSYGYDAVSRLLSADNPILTDESYTYDDVGNRLTSADVSGSWSYNTNNELLGYADVAYGYDDNGNLTQIRIAGSVVWTYTYDAANRLVHVEDGTGTISADYYYDPFGRRLWKEVDGTRTYFFYSEEGLIAEYDASGNDIKSYGYKPDSDWTTDPLFMKQNGDYYFYHTDHLGTPQKLVEQDGTVVWSAQYTAFGEADVQVETVTNNLRFPGQYEDAETGLYYNLKRYYDPQIGRYLWVDPIGFDGGDMNLFVYVFNNPVNFIDPVGLKGLKYSFDKETCILNIIMIWKVTFTDYLGDEPWTELEKEHWKRDVERILEEYFNNTGYRCYPNRGYCCICQGGVNVAFDLQFFVKPKKPWFVIKQREFDSTDFYDVEVNATKIRSKGGTTKIDGVIVGGRAHLTRYNLEPRDTGGPVPQIPVVHETGHMLGLEHPGMHMFPDNPRPPACFKPSPGTPPDIWEYDADPGSLMGRGMQLRIEDFQDAFCDHIKTRDANCDPWCPIPPP
jgi:RHS repeat-associated protein